MIAFTFPSVKFEADVLNSKCPPHGTPFQMFLMRLIELCHEIRPGPLGVHPCEFCGEKHPEDWKYDERLRFHARFYEL